MITEDKVMEICCMADDFCKFFDAMMAKYALESTAKRTHHRDSTIVQGRDHAHPDIFSGLGLSLSEAFF